MSRYFPDQDAPTKALLKDRPEWAKRAKLTQVVAEDKALALAEPTGRRGDSRHEAHMPQKDAKWVRALAAEHTAEALAGIWDLAQHCDDPKVRLAAYLAVLDRAWGKPQREVSHTGTATIRHVTDPGALHAKLVRAVETTDGPRELGPHVVEDATVEPE